MARRVFEMERENVNGHMSILDLCAGCGIGGLDFLFHCTKELNALPHNLDFVEIQEEYRAHFNLNKEQFEGLPLNFLTINYREMLIPEFRGKYDLILCNPPFFRLGQGRLSPSTFKNRCRFFIDSDFVTLIGVLEWVLKPQGSAYFLMRDLGDYSSDQLERLEDIRGTGFFRLAKSV